MESLSQNFSRFSKSTLLPAAPRKHSQTTILSVSIEPLPPEGNLESRSTVTRMSLGCSILVPISTKLLVKSLFSSEVTPIEYLLICFHGASNLCPVLCVHFQVSSSLCPLPCVQFFVSRSQVETPASLLCLNWRFLKKGSLI